MVTPFANDIFALIWIAFKNLYPDKECRCYWEPNIRNEEDGTECLGLTHFEEETGEVIVFVKPELSVADASEIFAHELAHVAVGVDHDHDEEWGKAFDNIFEEYNKIGNEMFDVHQSVEVTGGKDYVKKE